MPLATVTVANNFTSGVLTDVSIPSACDNQGSVFFRWIMTSNTAVNLGTVGNAGTSKIDDIIIKGTCTPLVVSSVNPSSGPVGTEVTITAASGLSGATATFNGVAATVVSSSATQLVVKIPTGATTGNLVVSPSGNCSYTTPYTVIKNDVTSCQSVITDLIIYEVHDEFSGSGGTITLYNGTSSTVNLSNYRLYRTGSYGDGNDINYATLSGTIASGALGIIRVTGTSCAPAATNGSITGGFNADDQITLRNSTGAIVIDDVHTEPSGPGFYMVRNPGAFAARTTYNAADWSTTLLGSGDSVASLGTSPATSSISPAVNSQPSVSLTCASTTAILTVLATEGFSGGNPLAYQWYVNVPNTATWTALTNTGVYTGATSSALNIASLTGLDGYQYYCQVRENSATCYTATTAVKIDTGVTTWFWDGSIFKWSNGAPTLSKAAIINGNYTTVTNGSFSACSVTVNATFTLTISPNTYVEIQNGLTNNGAVDVQNNGSLVQISDAAVNSGSISVKRDASQRKMDYVYWSSPVQSFPLNYFVTTGGTTFIYKWETLAPNPKGTLGNWVYPSETNMTVGKGYIVRGNSTFNNAAPTTWTANFTGTPNNGIVPVTLDRGGLSPLFDDNWSLIGNPYPSAIDADSFIARFGNNLSAEYKDIEGSVRLWTHTTLPTNTTSPFYQNFSLNYYPTDYITYNSLGSQTGPATFNGKIASGQSFLVLRNDGATANATTLNFDNALRSKNHNNSQFFKQSDNRLTSEKSRIWLDLVLPDNNAIRTLVGYVEGATLAKDNTYDAYTDYKNEVNFYSLINNEPMIIQGRPAPFDVNDQVPVGFKLPTSGSYKIAIATVDGLFSDRAQKIYLEDKLLNVIHEISQSPYQFTTESGIVNDRFILRFTNQSLATNNFELENTIKVFGMDNSIKAKSTGVSIKEVTVYNVLGQKLAEIIKTDSEINVNTVLKSNQALVVKVVLENGQIITKKLIF